MTSRAASRASRANRRLLASAAARIEGRAGYRRSLAALHQQVSAFRALLNEAQNARWLAVEEALLEHAARVNEAYYWEGVAARKPPEAENRPEDAAIASLAQLIFWLATR